MADKHTRNWISFFQDAGIEDHALAARYAAIFVDNEIRSSMLTELDMELLRVMGISKVGHVLGILKHAKHVHDTQLFAASQPSPASRSQSSGTSSPVIMVDITKASAKKNRTSATSRIIERYVKQPELNVAQMSRTPPVTTVRVGTSAKKPRAKVTDRLGTTAVTPSPSRLAPTSRLASSLHKNKTKFNVANTFETESQPTRPSPVGKRVGTKTKITDRLGAKPVAEASKRKHEISFCAEEMATEEIPTVKRVRRVLPEHEGGYSIRMPSGSTPRSREILAKMTARQPKTVFDRLGDAAVSSTTEAEEPVITITGFATQIVKAGNSVFSRLGGKREASPAPPPPAVQGVKARLGQQTTYKSTTAADSSVRLAERESRFKSENIARFAPADEGEVKYVGVLKKTPVAPKMQSRLGAKAKVAEAKVIEAGLKTISAGAKRNSSAGILGNPTNNTKLSAKDRLDLSARDSSTTTRPTKTRKFIMTNKKTGVKTIVYKMTDDDEPPHF